MPLTAQRSTYTASAAPPPSEVPPSVGVGVSALGRAGGSVGMAGVGSYAAGGTVAGTTAGGTLPPASTRAPQSIARAGTVPTQPSEYIYTVGILTVSDTASKHPDLDTSGPLIRSILEAHPADAFRIVGSATVPDEPDQVRKYVKMWTDQQRVALVITTGGTGFGVRDSTIEAVEPLITKVTPALTQALASFSLKKTPYAILSRAVTGIRQPLGHGTPGTLIITMPGSVKAVREYCDFLFGQSNPGLILHALDLIQGGDGKDVHKNGPRAEPPVVASVHARTESSSSGAGSGIGSYSPSVAQFTAGGRLVGHAAVSLHSHAHSHGAQSHQTPRPRTVQGSDAYAAYITHDPTGATSTRHRVSPYPILDLEQALGLIDRFTPSPNMPKITSTVTAPGLSGNPQVTTTTLAIMPTPLPVGPGLRGHVLAEDVRATTDLPHGPTSNVDGYAVSANDTAPGEYKVITAATLARRLRDGAAGAAMPRRGEVYRINTGQGLPLGTDAVIMVEDTVLVEAAYSSSASMPAGEEKRIRLLAQVDVGENVRPKGSDVAAGTLVLQKGTMLGALGGEIGTLAFVGRKEVLVYPKPRVAVLSTGTELLDISLAPGSKSNSPRVGENGTDSPKVGAAVQAAAQINAQQQPWGFTVYDSNRPGLIAAIEGQGFDVIDLGIVGDDIEATTKALRRGLKHADVVITTGGTSMGESDLLKPIIERELRGAIHFGRVAMKPGKPTTFATIAATDPDEIDRLLFALPGNPASALVCFYIFVLPSLRKLAGYNPTTPLNTHAQYSERAGMGAVDDGNREPRGNPWTLPKVSVVLAQSVMTDPRPEFHRVVVRAESGQFVAYSTGNQRSSGMHSMATANALVCVPARRQDTPIYRLEAGEKVEAILLG
ncbi:hypothetical protein OC861_002167 [Tilletia horrida]|nr:hypothetical protein OC845_001888 [Tilletia horrida]KAK0568224.1 hypothetical protein OC861_002167 [Tilletia horrida]